MFKQLLVLIDGSELTKKALKKVAALAKADGSQVVLAYVSDPTPPMVYGDSTLGYGFTQKEHKKACDSYAKALFKKAAPLLGMGLKVSTLHLYHPNLAEGILEAAKKSKADVIVMASHKRSGIKGMLLGSEAQEVIVHATLPVLVLG